MIREHGLEALTLNPRSCVTVGTFDGVHRGHQVLLAYLQERAQAQNGQSTVVTFDPHPREVVREEAVPLLTTIDERAEVCAALGIDRFIVLPFTKAFAQLSAEAFVETVLVRRIGLQEIVIGFDHGFGRGREGDRQLLETLGQQHGFRVDVIPAARVADHVVSSSEVRHLLVETGDLVQVTRMLGRPYALQGQVVAGDRRGHTLGYPTANLALLHPRKVVPKNGVYAVRVCLSGGQYYGGMLNIGTRPTFEGHLQRIEVHLFGFDGDLYGQQLRIEFVERLREERKFDGIDALKRQLSEDEARSKRLLSEDSTRTGGIVPSP
jgi:riboflavin kinase/FMN adenylyltransferase